MFYNEFTSRFFMMLTKEQQANIFSKRILLFGVGGVGGSVVHMLARSGINNLTVVDFDTIATTNINRQLVATSNNVGKIKVEEIKNQLTEINPGINITAINLKLDAETITQLDLSSYDYVVDCIDDVPAKKLLIKKCYELNVPILCAMGAGNRYEGIPMFEISKIEKTSYDPLAKILRKFCAEEGIKNLQVCYTKQKALKFNCKTIGSVVYYTMNMASVMCAKIINDIIS